MDRIIPFFASANPLREIYEDRRAIRRYVDEHRLIDAARSAWDMRRFMAVGARRAVLKHLCDQIVDDNPDPPLKPRRFTELRGRGLLDAYGDCDTFADLMSAEDWDGLAWPELQYHVALYIEPQGQEGPHFSSEAFFLHYLEAHERP